MRKLGRRGSSLIETLFAMVVLSIGVFAAGTIHVRAGRLYRLTNSRAALSAIGLGKVEQLRGIAEASAGAAAQVSVGGSLTSSVANHVDSVQDARGRWFRTRWTIDSTVGGTLSLTVRVEPTNLTEPYSTGVRDFQTLLLPASP